MHTDAIWRACRIILDIRMHRGELDRRRGDRLPRRAHRVRAAATPRAEVQWYTYRPTYPLSYLLGRTLLLELRADEQRRLGDEFSLKGFHDALLRNGSLPISFHRRLLAGAGRLTARARHPLDRPRGRPLAASSTGRAPRPASARRPTARSASRSGSSGMGARLIHLVDFDGARAGAPANLERSVRSRRGSPSRSSSPAASTPPRRSGSRSPPARPGSS